MRVIASFENERSAKLFADVLCVHDIDTQISKGRDGSYSVWVLEERNMEASRAAWAAFDAHPDAPEHLGAEGCVERKTRTVEKAERRSRHEIIDMRQRFRSGSRQLPKVTVVLVALSIAATLAVQFLASGLQIRALLSIAPSAEETFGGGLLSHVWHGEVWRLITPIFVHYGLLHILFNMWWLLDLGAILEHRLGSFRFFLVIMVSAALSNAAQYLITGSPYFGGMSGVVYALFGYVWIRGRFDPSMGFALTQGTVIALLVWLVLGFTGALGAIANYAHLGGLVTGALLGASAAFSARRR